jgi:hypothetical protein
MCVGLLSLASALVQRIGRGLLSVLSSVTDSCCCCCCCSFQVIAIGQQDLPSPVKALMRAPLVERMIAEIFQIFIMTPKDVGSFDLQDKQEALVY